MNAEGAHFDIGDFLFDILRFRQKQQQGTPNTERWNLVLLIHLKPETHRRKEVRSNALTAGANSPQSHRSRSLVLDLPFRDNYSLWFDGLRGAGPQENAQGIGPRET